MNRLLTQWEVCEFLRISYSTLCRWLNAGTFPQPVNGRGRGKKLLWTQDAITQWMNRNSESIDIAPLVNVCNPSKLKREAREWEERQRLAKATLERHAACRRKSK